jgi:phosphatidylglycerophosphatase A
LAAPDPWSNYRKALEERHIGTGNWFLNSTEFTSWKTNLGSFLWLYGKPGSGKSILAGSIIERVMNHRRPGMAVAFFFFDFADSEKQHHEKMIRSLITQLSTQNSHVPQALDSLFSSCSNGNIQPSLESLLSLLREIIEQFHETFVIIDALDECKIRDKLLTVIDEIVGWKLDRLHILTTSRKEYDIQELMNELSEDQERICVQDVKVRNDICAYVRDRIQIDRNLKRWQKDVEMQQEIEETLVKKADGM